MTASLSGSTFNWAPQHGQVKSKFEVFAIFGCIFGNDTANPYPERQRKLDEQRSRFQRGSSRIGSTWNRNSSSQINIITEIAAALIASTSPIITRARPESKHLATTTSLLCVKHTALAT